MRRTWLLGMGVVAIVLLAAPPADAQVKAGKAVRVQGRIVRMQGPDRFVVRTADAKEVIFHTHPKTRFLAGTRVIRFDDLRVGADINATYVLDGDRHLVETVTVGEAVEEPPPEGTVLEGSVVRVVGEDQVVLRNAAGKEVIVYVAPQTKYTFDDRPARFVDIRPGVNIRVNYDVRDRRNVARSIIGLRRK